MQFHLIIIFCFLFLNFPLAQTNNINSSMPSLMPFQSSPNSKPIMHIGAIEENENMRFLTGIQFSPAKNLLIGGVISPLKAQSDLSVYYHLAIGFKTKWKLLNTASNMFQIGMHRNRFENEYGPLYEKYGLGTTIWSPLASGALTGKYLDGIPEGSRATLSGYEWLKKSMVESDRGQERMGRVTKLAPIAEKLNIRMSKLAIAWCLLNKNVSTVILGASKIDQLKENL